MRRVAHGAGPILATTSATRVWRTLGQVGLAAVGGMGPAASRSMAMDDLGIETSEQGIDCSARAPSARTAGGRGAAAHYTIHQRRASSAGDPTAWTRIRARATFAPMRFCYAHRRATLYPTSFDSWNLAPDDYTAAFLRTAKDIGFDAIEVGVEVLERTGGSERQVKAFGRRLREAGMPIGCVRAGGALTDARHGPRNRARQASAIQFAGWVGATVVNTALSAPARRPGNPAGSLPGSQHGWPVAQDASRDAQLSEYEALAKACQTACDQAADAGVTDLDRGPPGLNRRQFEVHDPPAGHGWSPWTKRRRESRSRQRLLALHPARGDLVSRAIVAAGAALELLALQEPASAPSSRA